MKKMTRRQLLASAQATDGAAVRASATICRARCSRAPRRRQIVAAPLSHTGATGRFCRTGAMSNDETAAIAPRFPFERTTKARHALLHKSLKPTSCTIAAVTTR
jgi:hypothetical protein